jgi:hypothetical protein
MRASWRRIGVSTNFATVLFTNAPITAVFTGGNVQAAPQSATNQFQEQITLNLQATYPALTNASTNFFYVVLTNSLGSVTSSPARLTVLLPPKITSQPVTVATNVGATVFFAVGASGSPPLNYTWLFNGNNLNVPNATNVLELDNVDTNSAGNYSVIVSNAVGSVTSSNAFLTVDGSPIINQQPTNTTVPVGSNTVFTAVASGANPLAYQWYFYPDTNTPATPLADGTNIDYTLASAQTNNAGFYFLQVTNSFGSVTSSVVTLTVLTPPVITTTPTNMVTATSKAVSFVAGATGGLPMRASWWRMGVSTNFATVLFTNAPITAVFTGGNVQVAPPSATNQFQEQITLNLQATYPALTNASTNFFYVVLTNSLGSVTSSPARLTVLLPPKITSQPVNVATNVGATAFFTVGASGGPPLNYTWLFNGTNLNVPNATNLLELDNVDTNSAGNYSVIVSNAVGSVTSSNAYLTTLYNGSLTRPELWLLSHDPNNGDAILMALEAGKNYRILSSTDLMSWQTVTNFLSQSSFVTFTNTIFTNIPSLYYRIITP